MFGKYEPYDGFVQKEVLQKVSDPFLQENLLEEFNSINKTLILNDENIAVIKAVIYDKDASIEDYYNCLHEIAITTFQQKYDALKMVEDPILAAYKKDCDYNFSALRSLKQDPTGVLYECCQTALKNLEAAIQLIGIFNHVNYEILSGFEDSNVKIISTIEKIKAVINLQALITANKFDKPVSPLSTTPDQMAVFAEKKETCADQLSQYKNRLQKVMGKIEEKMDSFVDLFIRKGADEWEAVVRKQLTFENSFSKTDPQNEDDQRNMIRDIEVLTDALKAGYEKIIIGRKAGGVDIRDSDIPLMIEKCVSSGIHGSDLNRMIDEALNLQNQYELGKWIWDVLKFKTESDNCYCAPCGVITAAKAAVHCTLYKDVPNLRIYDIRMPKMDLHNRLLGVTPQLCFHVSTESVEVTTGTSGKKNVANHAYRVGSTILYPDVNVKYFPAITPADIKRDLETCKTEQVKEYEARIDRFVDKKGIGCHRNEISKFLTTDGWLKRR